MKKLSLIIILSILVKISTSQNNFECTMLEGTSQKSATCNDWNNYAAVDPINTPIKTVRITFHVMQKSIGSANFPGNFPDNEASRSWLSGPVMNEINGRMGGLQPMSLPTSSLTITDCRVRFTWANTYFWQDDYGWAFQPTYTLGNYLNTKFVLNQPSVDFKDNSVHIFICGTASGNGAAPFGDKEFILIGNIYSKYPNDAYGSASIIAHELGHSLGLHHTWGTTSGDDDTCNDTPQNPNCWNVNEPRRGETNTGQCVVPSNNLMDYNAGQNALTICQVNRMHYFLLGGDGNIGDCVISGVSVANPTIVGHDLICSSGANYISDNLQLGVTSQWSASPSNFFQTSSGCSNTTNVIPVSSSVGGEGQINYTFDWQNYGTSTVSKNVWVGKVNQLDLCAFDRNIYQADAIFSPGASCLPMSAIIDNGKSVTLAGGEVTLNGGFEVTNGSEFQVIVGNGCDLELSIPTLVATSTVSFLTCNSATSGGNVISDGGAPVTERGLCWGTSPNPTIANSKVISGSGTGLFSATFSPLAVGTTYYVRSYATNSAGTSYGAQVSYTRGISVPLLLPTTAASFITCSSATSGGNVISDGCGTIILRGVCYGTTPNPTIANSKTNDSGTTGSWTSGNMTIVPGTLYYMRSYATNSAGTGYGSQVSYQGPLSVPVLAATTSASSITYSSASSGGNVTSDGCGTVTARGICWATSQNPTTANPTTTNGSGTGTFTGNLTGLTASTTYYVRSYATNSAGTAYGAQTSFTTLAPPIVVPTLAATTTATSITQTTATSGGNVTSDGGSTVSNRGICWSTSSSPTTANSTYTTGTGTGSFTAYLTGLSAGTTYYVRSFATNSVGTGYGSQISFTTPVAQVPSLAATAAVTNISATSATSGGNITSGNGSAVTARGVCWSTSSNPTTDNSKTVDGSGVGTFTSSITGLSANTPYYVRVYATNGVGTAYGSQVSFTSSSVVITASISYQVFSTQPTTIVIGWFANLTSPAPSGNTLPAIITNASGSGTHTASGYVAQGQVSGIMIETVYYSRLAGSNYTATCGFGTMPAGFVAGATGSVTIPKQ